MDRTALTKRVIRNVLQAPVVSLPLGLGAATMAVAAATGDTFGFLGFLGVSGVLLGVGMATSRLLLSTEQLTQEAYAELLDEQEDSRESRLQALAQRLSRDGDPRTGQLLSEMQRNYRRLNDNTLMRDGAHARLLPEIKSQAEGLFQSCLGSLERTLLFWEAAQQMATRDAREELLQSREDLIQEIQSSSHCLGQTLDQLQKSAILKDHGADLAAIREDLERGLQVAQQVDQRMSQIEKGLGGSVRVRE